jgi:hypothetical protein
MENERLMALMLSPNDSLATKWLSSMELMEHSMTKNNGSLGNGKWKGV